MKAIVPDLKMTLLYKSFSRSYWLSSTQTQSKYFTNLNLRCDSKTITSIG